MVTNLGNFTLQLYPKKAPRSVANILKYVDDGYYTDIIFHRVIKNFMIQAGAVRNKLVPAKPKYPPVPNEADNGLKNLRASLAMARTSDPHSATAQFFINTKNNPQLDHRTKTAQGWGYTVFGKVISGMNVIRRIARQPTTSNNFPSKAIIIKSISRI
ncbi:MAG: peptidyl-prolyl cis-trans isomerase cyclophilin type [Osedax symbiont Rs1]|nr:MAG: peptidyl-prolyl cis-trans isomerase cyclophilin type [Osedax symbiont Rs1]